MNAPELASIPRHLPAAVPFVFIRHGETEANRQGIIAGSHEPPLNDTGMAQARSIATLMAQGRWQTVFVSPQHRARQTAQLALPDYDPVIVDGLRERHWGELEGHPMADICPRYETPPGGEAFEAMCVRVFDAMTVVQGQITDHVPVIVAHSGVIRCILHLAGFDGDGPQTANATPILFRPEGRGWRHDILSDDLIKEISR
ncbi:MAG: histidine phosphatase family protein [Pseudomonadota bacterium]